MAQKRLLHDLFSCNTNMVCKVCDKYLTVVPIHFVDDIGSVCGRCTLKAKEMFKEDTKFHRQFVFEALLKEYCFPCSNQKYGCKENLKWDDDVLEHESECQFKKEICPLNYDFFDGIEKKCEWTGKTEEFVQHVEETHGDLIEKNPFKLVLKNEGENLICFNRTDLQLVTIVLKYFKDSVYYFMVLLHGTQGDSQCYSVNLKLFDKNENTCLVLRRNKLESLQDLENGFESDFNDRMFKIDLITVGDWRQFQDDIVLKFEIIKKSVREINIIKKSNKLLAVDETPESGVNQMVLKLLKCTHCDLFMLDEIYKCENYHSICEKCEVDNCQICKSDTFIRDAYLEKISADTFVCSNKSKGCKFMSKFIAVDIHEKICNFRIIRCFKVSCKWTGSLNSLQTHFEKNHKQYLTKGGLIRTGIMIIEDYYKPNAYHYSVLIFDCQLFSIFTLLKDANFHINIFHYECENITKYNFIFRLFHSSQPDICLTIPGSCVSYNENNVFEGETIVSSKRLQIFSSRTLIIMSIEIFKVDE